MTFQELDLKESLLESLEAMGFEKATPIQQKAIPIIKSGHDLIACAQTGTGKTAAFLLPVINNLIDNSVPDSIDALILVPTRELAIQIDRELMGFSYFTGLSSTAIYGGRDGDAFNLERKALTSGANIVVATPGRLIAHLQMGYVKFGKLRHLILDEADRMLDMGFIGDIRKIDGFTPPNKQTLMFSATMPTKIRTFAKQILKQPKQINIAVSKPAEGVLQTVYEIHSDLKVRLLKHLLTSRQLKEGERILIFSSTKANVKRVAQTLHRAKLGIAEIHSDLDQGQRELTLRDFKNGNAPILVATDILSRGIDVKGIDLVINYDVPSDGEDYIHRVGRTARADATGVAITLVNGADRYKFKDIEALMEQRVARSPLPPDLKKENDELPLEQPRKGRGGGGGRRRRSSSGGNNRGTSKKRSGGNNRQRSRSRRGTGNSGSDRQRRSNDRQRRS
ncbi:MAG: DEAD/DEAH box helicase [Bacteroidota bacterium]